MQLVGEKVGSIQRFGVDLISLRDKLHKKQMSHIQKLDSLLEKFS